MEKPAKTVRKKWPRRMFSPAFKTEVVHLCRAGNRNTATVAKDLDPIETALCECVHRANAYAGKGRAGALKSLERNELAPLRREIKQLQTQRESPTEVAKCFATQSPWDFSSSTRSKTPVPSPCPAA